MKMKIKIGIKNPMTKPAKICFGVCLCNFILDQMIIGNRMNKIAKVGLTKVNTVTSVV